MAVIGDRQIERVMRLTRLLSRWADREGPIFLPGEDVVVGVQNPVALSVDWMPQPDLVLVYRGREGRMGVPAPGEVLLW